MISSKEHKKAVWFREAGLLVPETLSPPVPTFKKNVSVGYMDKEILSSGVPVVAQWLTNPTRNHEVEGSVPALAQWVNDPALP